ncbi:GNAT family N-acetyltransferase [Roseibium aggregatum]|uniref:GNAT family N-acetyltransferase n=1 Tax=Roseibium aggregatum TaxID=187304 RepID=UPI001E638E25|nr:GNAT family N-acetyltransferase [Roseibium aggregatum]UES58541.1 GNAT family N-acetyltransferase [Roseibium aggregatum]
MSIITGIRQAEISDVAKIATIHVECWREVYTFMPDEVQSQRGFEYRSRQWQHWFETRPPGQAVYVLEDGKEVVGFAVAKPNSDPAIDAIGEFHACYILPEYRGGASGPMAMQALAEFLKSEALWPACVWAFKSNPYRRIYPALGCEPKVFRDRFIAGVALPEIGYRVTDFDKLMARLDRMRASAAQRQIQSPRPQLLSSHLPA